MTEKPLKLSVSLVPIPLWKFNLRCFTTQTRWYGLRRQIIEERGARCDTCGAHVEDSKRLHLHEEWHYDEEAKPPTVTLRGLSLSCWHCHAVEHFQMTRTLIRNGKLNPSAEAEVIAHFCTVNGCDEATFHAHQKEAQAVMSRRSDLHWRMDWGAYTDLVLERYTEIPQPGRLHKNDMTKRTLGYPIAVLISWPGDPDYAGADGIPPRHIEEDKRQKAWKKQFSKERKAAKENAKQYRAELKKQAAKRKARAEARERLKAKKAQAAAEAAAAEAAAAAASPS